MIESLDEKKICEYKIFEEIFLQLLSLHAPTKKKVIRANNMPYMTKTLRKAIMRRPALKNKFYKSKSLQDENAFKKQRNFCNMLYKREKRKYFNSLNLKDITDTKLFWKTVKPFLSNKRNLQKQITLIEDNNIFSDDKIVAEKLSNYFENAVKSLNIEENKLLLTMPYMTKTLRKAIMRRPALKNKFYKSKSLQDENAFKKQRNFCNMLYKREKRKYFNSLNLKDITDTKLFWKTVKPFLSNKRNLQKQITLIEDNNIFSDDKIVAEKLSNCFENAVKSLNIEENKLLLTHVTDVVDPINVIIKRYENHPSILAIKGKVIQPMQDIQ